ncbi:MAG TPA: hypothetical protein VGG59_10805 [Acidobacteriaceae bacterium]
MLASKGVDAGLMAGGKMIGSAAQGGQQQPPAQPVNFNAPQQPPVAPPQPNPYVASAAAGNNPFVAPFTAGGPPAPGGMPNAFYGG